ncbi:hypothetical protein BD626DRAFT_625764 [Schizophyllum amplum]|uniref:Uncharacterized protein n=1 Tax=Schizophyllum amplum TaxID=97359 RepID=A0A550D0S8_9AGAR|nr:hypothetical protein BD626DRAFT_625764 [Auriculariopsis ampla]
MSHLPCNCPIACLAGPEGKSGASPEAGDIRVVVASLFDPFYSALGKDKPRDNYTQTHGSTVIGSKYNPQRSIAHPTSRGSTLYDDSSPSDAGKRRPAIVLRSSKKSRGNGVEMEVCLMGTFSGVAAADISNVFQRYISHIYTDTMPDKKANHLHASPEWRGPSQEQWVIPLIHKMEQASVPPRWRTSRGRTRSEEGYILHDDALTQLRNLATKTFLDFDKTVVSNRSGARSVFVEKLDAEYRRRHPIVKMQRRNPTKRTLASQHTKRFSVSRPTPVAISAF